MHRNADGLDLSDRILGAVVALLFAVPAIALLWLGLSVDAAHLNLVLASGYFWAGAAASTLFGFIFPKALPDMIGGLWRLIYKYLRWW